MNNRINELINLYLDSRENGYFVSAVDAAQAIKSSLPSGTKIRMALNGTVWIVNTTQHEAAQVGCQRDWSKRVGEDIHRAFWNAMLLRDVPGGTLGASAMEAFVRKAEETFGTRYPEGKCSLLRHFGYMADLMILTK